MKCERAPAPCRKCRMLLTVIESRNRKSARLCGFIPPSGVFRLGRMWLYFNMPASPPFSLTCRPAGLRSVASCHLHAKARRSRLSGSFGCSCGHMSASIKACFGRKYPDLIGRSPPSQSARLALKARLTGGCGMVCALSDERARCPQGGIPWARASTHSA